MPRLQEETPNNCKVLGRYSKEEKHLTDILKKKLQKMEGILYKFRNDEITFPEMISRLTKIEEFYKDD